MTQWEYSLITVILGFITVKIINIFFPDTEEKKYWKKYFDIE